MIRHFLSKWASDERGHVAIMTAAASPALIAALGLGTEVGYWYYKEREAQLAVDVAAYTAAYELRNGSNITDIRNEATMFEIVRYIIDRFNNELSQLMGTQPNSRERFFYVNCRNSASEGDFNTNPLDDFHPNSQGFEKIANKFLDVLRNN